MTNQTVSTKVYLIRHGITDWIEQGILHGRTDRPLSSFGLQQAELTAAALQGSHAVRLFTSPLQRAKQTAQAIGNITNLELESMNNLQEMDFGWMEGKKDFWPILKGNKGLVNLYYLTRQISGKLSGESFSHFKLRVWNAWSLIRSQADGQNIIVVAHSGVLRIILLHEFGGKFSDATRFSLAACSISKIEVSADVPSKIIYINNTSHLNGRGSL